MEDLRITFTVHKISSYMCRITADTILQDFRRIADGGCICSLDVMLSEMSHISKETEKAGAKAVFEFFGE